MGGYGETASVSSSSQDKILQTFNKYKDGASGNIEVEGVQKFFEDSGIRDPSDIVTLLLSSKMNAQNMGVYTQQEFVTGFKALGVSTTDDLKRKIPQLQNDLRIPDEFKKMYKFVYDFARDKAFKNLQLEVALDLWELLLLSKCKFLSDWIEFLRNEKKDL